MRSEALRLVEGREWGIKKGQMLWEWCLLLVLKRDDVDGERGLKVYIAEDWDLNGRLEKNLFDSGRSIHMLRSY
jgi:hypothetical protein